MTITAHPDYLALLRGVLLSPNDDLPRLVLADWLDEPERTGSVPCEKCGGRGEQYSMGGPESDWEDCPTCNGTGYVSNGNAERAEFIRLQCKIARTRGKVCSSARNAEKSLLLRNWPSWAHRLNSRDTCEVILSDRWRFKGVPATVFTRGFVSSIRLTAEQFEKHAAELFAAHPITEVVMSDKEPYEVVLIGKAPYFDDSYDDEDASEEYTWFHYRNDDEDSITPEIFIELEDYESGGVNCRNYRTRELALAALSRACVRYGRRLAGLKEEYAQ